MDTLLGIVDRMLAGRLNSTGREDFANGFELEGLIQISCSLRQLCGINRLKKLTLGPYTEDRCRDFPCMFRRPEPKLHVLDFLPALARNRVQLA